MSVDKTSSKQVVFAYCALKTHYSLFLSVPLLPYPPLSLSLILSVSATNFNHAQFKDEIVFYEKKITGESCRSNDPLPPPPHRDKESFIIRSHGQLLNILYVSAKTKKNRIVSSLHTKCDSIASDRGSPLRIKFEKLYSFDKTQKRERDGRAHILSGTYKIFGLAKYIIHDAGNKYRKHSRKSSGKQAAVYLNHAKSNISSERGRRDVSSSDKEHDIRVDDLSRLQSMRQSTLNTRFPRSKPTICTAYVFTMRVVRKKGGKKRAT